MKQIIISFDFSWTSPTTVEEIVSILKKEILDLDPLPWVSSANEKMETDFISRIFPYAISPSLHYGIDGLRPIMNEEEDSLIFCSGIRSWLGMDAVKYGHDFLGISPLYYLERDGILFLSNKKKDGYIPLEEKSIKKEFPLIIIRED